MALVGILFAGVVSGQGVGKDGPAEADVRDVVQSQLDAFRNNDFKTAYGFAHSGIRRQFGEAQFEEMVRGGFPSMLLPGP